MRISAFLMSLLLLAGCGTLRFSAASRRIGTAAVKSVSAERNLTFTPAATSTVIKKTDSFLKPQEVEVAKDPNLEKQLARQVKEALEGNINSYYLLDNNFREVTGLDLKWFAVSARDYGVLELASKPPEASVICHGCAPIDTVEGKTTIKRSYPVGGYVFELRKEGCEGIKIPVEIKKNLINAKMVTLECKRP